MTSNGRLCTTSPGWAVLARFTAKVRRGDDGDTCWEWTGSISPKGYGRLTAGGISHYAHRFAYELFTGPVPEGLDLDHLCRNRACVNPDHLEPVTARENARRGMTPATHALNTDHCINGHPFDVANTRIDPAKSRRVCRACIRNNVKRYRLRRQEVQS